MPGRVASVGFCAGRLAGYRALAAEGGAVASVAVVRIDINGQLVALRQRLAEELRDAAASSASTSLTRRDLSLVLDHAIRTSKLVALQRAEARSLAELLDEQDWGADVAELRDALQRD